MIYNSTASKLSSSNVLNERGEERTSVEQLEDMIDCRI